MVDILNHGDISILDQVNTYNLDGRMSIAELYKNYDRLLVAGWSKELVYEQTLDEGRRLPIYAYISPGESDKWLWILSGVHGEEPAGPNAFAEEVNLIRYLPNQNIPVVMIPLLNPKGYVADDRYFDEHRDHEKGHSVTDAEHLLPKLDDPTQMRASSPTSAYASEVFSWIANKLSGHPPFLVVDHHEDEIENTSHVDSRGTYCYANGDPEALRSLLAIVSQGLEKIGFSLLKNHSTRFDKDGNKEQTDERGFIINAVDGSIDEYLYLVGGAKAVVVIETTRDDSVNIPLEIRKVAQGEIINLYEKLWKTLDNAY